MDLEPFARRLRTLRARAIQAAVESRRDAVRQASTTKERPREQAPSISEPKRA